MLSPKETDATYHLEEEDGLATDPQQQQERSILTNRIQKLGLLAAILGLFAIGIVVKMVRNNSSKQDKVWTVDSSIYGVPDQCEGMTTICSEDRCVEGGVVQCTCGAYIFQYSEQEGDWVLLSN